MVQQQCASCSGVGSADHFQSHKGKTLCLPCLQNAAQHKKPRNALASAAYFVVLMVLLYALGGVDAILGMIPFIAIFLAARCLLIFIHELGHVLIGALVGEKVIGATVGQGPSIASLNLGYFRFQLRAWPVGGATRFIPTGGKFGRAMMLLAGVVFELALVVVVFRLQVSGLATHARDAIIFFGLTDIVINLWPRIDPGTGLQSDGGELLAIIRGEEATTNLSLETALTAANFQEAVAEGRYDHALELAENEISENPKQLEGQIKRGTALLLARRYREAATALYPLLGHQDLNESQAVLLDNNFAYAAIMTFDPPWIKHADAPSARAMTKDSLNPAIVSTRGSVLVMTDRVEKGERYLQQSLTAIGHKNPKDRASILGMLALAAAIRGDLVSSRERYNDMTIKDPDSEGRDDIERQLAQYEVAALARLVISADADGHGDIAYGTHHKYIGSLRTMATLALLGLDAGNAAPEVSDNDQTLRYEGKNVSVARLQQAANQLLTTSPG